jgi:metal-dependent amidase/aminoacylase/carboxypeptidase family protein
LLGEKQVIGNFPTVMGSEDFQEVFAPLKTPYAFLLIGVAPMDMVVAAQKAGRQFPYSNHNPDFFVDMAAIPLGAKIDTVAVLGILGK